jgi:CubicO group peptidase (beta-lactamase class C family)
MTLPRSLPTPSSADRAALPNPLDQFSWTDAQKLVAHRNMHHLFPSHVVKAGATARDLPREAEGGVLESLAQAGADVTAYMADAEVTGLLAIRRGRIVLERYARGNDDSTVWASRSMAKSITSLMIGTAVRSKHIRSVDDPVVRYVPELAGTHYDGVTLRHCLQMTSGVPYSEDYTDLSSDVARLQACTVQGRKGGFLAFLKDLGSRPDRKGNVPGSVFNYCSADSVLAGLVLERATGQIAPVHLERELWSRIGVEGDAYWNLEAEGGSAFTASGFGATLRDYGRLGLFVLEGAKLPDGTSMLPEGWMQDSLIPSQASIDAGSPYGFQWWLHEHKGVVSTKVGAGPARLRGGSTVFYALGNAGQIILVNPAEETVVVKWAVWGVPSKFEERRHQDQRFFAALLEALTAKR